MSEAAATVSGRRRRILGLVRKESRQIVRDPSTILVAVILPLILLFVFGYGVTFDPRSFTIGLVVEQPPPESGSFQAALANSRYFNVESARDRRTFEPALIAGEIHGIVVLPADFSERVYREETPPIQVIVDGSDPNTAILLRDYLQLLWVNWVEQESISRGRPLLPAVVILQAHVWFNPEISSRHYLVPGSLAIILTLIGALLTALVVAREWERGTMEALLATPVDIVELIAGKLVPYFLLGMGSMLLSVATAVLVFDVPFRGTFVPLILVSAFFMWAALGQGLLISTITRNQLVAAQISILTAFLPAFYFSDFVFEVGSMPWPLQALSYAVPARYYISSLQTLFLAGDVWSVILRDLLGLTVIAGIFFLLIAFTTRRRLE